MLKGIKKVLVILKPLFEPIGDDKTHDTYKSSLNYEAGGLYYIMLFSMFLWPAYIPYYLRLHPLPILSAIVIAVYGVTCFVLVLIRLQVLKLRVMQYSRPLFIGMSY